MQPSYMQRENTTIISVLEVISFKDNSWKFCYFKKTLTMNSILKTKNKKKHQMQRLYFTQQPKGVALSKGVKRDFFWPWPRVPFVLHCPKSLVLKRLHRANTFGSLFCHLYCTLSINWVNILPILSLFFWLHRMLASLQTCWVPILVL